MVGHVGGALRGARGAAWARGGLRSATQRARACAIAREGSAVALTSAAALTQSDANFNALIERLEATERGLRDLLAAQRQQQEQQQTPQTQTPPQHPSPNGEASAKAARELDRKRPAKLQLASAAAAGAAAAPSSSGNGHSPALDMSISISHAADAAAAPTPAKGAAGAGFLQAAAEPAASLPSPRTPQGSLLFTVNVQPATPRPGSDDGKSPLFHFVDSAVDDSAIIDRHHSLERKAAREEEEEEEDAVADEVTRRAPVANGGGGMLGAAGGVALAGVSAAEIQRRIEAAKRAALQQAASIASINLQ
jgi:hypothetical protein